MNPSVLIRPGAAFVPLFFAAVLATPATAQSRVPEPVTSSDVKTEREPSFMTGTAPARPSITPPVVAPKSAGAAHPSLSSWIDHSRMYYAAGSDGAIWARGATYKASFDANGAIYFPAFGKRQPHDVAHVLSPDSVTIGGEAIAFERGSSATRADDDVAIDRGAFVESYALTPQSLEQTFTFDTLPRSGDLVMHIPVASELEAVDCGERLEFRGEFGRVTYGHATAIDSRGSRFEAPTQLVGGAITIRVDASFLASATLPLVIDPVISSFSIDVSANDNYWADAAYDPSAHSWLIVYEEWFSATDRDAAYGFASDTAPTGSGFYLDLSGNSWDSLHCANNAAAHQFMVVSSVTSGAQVYVLASTMSPTGIPGTQTVVTGTEIGTIRNCVIGGDPYTGGAGPSYYCIAYERQYSSSDWDILTRCVSTSGALIGSGPNYLSNSGGTIDVGPAISKSDGTHDWMVVWQRNNGYFNDADVWGGIVHWDGTTFAAPFQISAWFQPEWQVAVSSPLNGTLRYLATWQDTDSGDHDIIVALLDGSTVLDQQDLSIQEQYNYTLDQVESTVDSDGDHFLVAYSEQYGGADYDIYAADLFVNGTTLGLAQRHVNMDYSGSGDHSPRVVSAFSSGGQGPNLKHHFLGAWNSTPSGGGPADVKGDFFDTFPGGIETPFCFGDGSVITCPCGNNGASGHGCGSSVNSSGALLTWTGFPSTSYDSFFLLLTGVPASAPCTFFQGTLSSAPGAFGDGLRCTGGTLRRLKSVTASAGQATYPGLGDIPITVQGAIPVDGATRTYQVSYRNAAMFCTTSTFNISNGLQVTWAH